MRKEWPAGSKSDFGKFGMASTQWMMPHAANLINRLLVGSDGKTAYYKIHHRCFKAAVFEFWEQDRAKGMRETNGNSGTATKRKLSFKLKCIEGTWLGFSKH